MPHELLKYIKDNGLNSLEDKLAIKIKRHSKYPNLVLLKYSQLDSPFDNKVVQQCRGIILDIENNFKVVSYPYDKFFNYEEGLAADIDWDTARVYEKLDGSLMTMYYYDNTWHIATSGTPDASGNVLNTDNTFANLFWSTWKKLLYKLPNDSDKNKCFMFELMTPFNRIVVRHKESKIVLHGVRNLETYAELNPVIEGHIRGWDVVKTFPLTSWNEVLEASKHIDPMEGEGFVVADANYNRVKVKSSLYCMWSRETDGMSTRRILESVREREESEFLPKFIQEYPEYIGIYGEVLARYNKILGEIEGFYEAIKDIDDRKAFAMKATTKWFSGALFGMKFGKFRSAREYLANVKIQDLEKRLGIKLISL